MTAIESAVVWACDLAEARRLLVDGPRSDIELEWLHEIIDGATHDERRALRAGLEVGPRSLWYDYDQQMWID